MVRREYALRPGTLAPLVGTLMEVVRGIRCPDGRLILLVMAVGRIRVRVDPLAMAYDSPLHEVKRAQAAVADFVAPAEGEPMSK